MKKIFIQFKKLKMLQKQARRVPALMLHLQKEIKDHWHMKFLQTIDILTIIVNLLSFFKETIKAQLEKTRVKRKSDQKLLGASTRRRKAKSELKKKDKSKKRLPLKKKG